MNSINEIFDLYDRNFKKDELSAEALKAKLSSLSIVLYGAGTSGLGILYGLKKIGIEPLAWLDGNSQKWGQIFQNLAVFNPETYKPDANTLVVVCINTDGQNYCESFDEALKQGGHSAVYQKLYTLGYKQIIDYSHFWRCYELFDGNPYPLPSVSDVRGILAHKEQILESYTLLADQPSRDVFLSLLAFWLFDRATPIPTHKDRWRYFAPDIFKINKDDYFVDGGAYDGMYLERFLAYTNEIKGYAAFECDAHNFLKLEARLREQRELVNAHAKLYTLALADKEQPSNFYSLKGPGSFMSDLGPDVVTCDSLDSLLHDQPISFVKMNLGGGELSALRGAKRLIEKNTPILAIANYHHTKDVWEILLEYKKLGSHYQLFMRSYMKNLSLTAYAVPNHRLTLSSGTAYK